MSISVCMASYNGEKYIARQLGSILSQLGDDDEVIIVDDASKDSTIDVIKGIADSRIKVFVNESNRGEVYSFDRTLSLAKGEFLFLSDQDDIWIPGRAELMRKRLEESGALVIASNFEWMDSDERPVNIEYDGVEARQSSRYVRNILDIFIGKTNYFGCAMAIRRPFLPVISPVPVYVESHDLWVALAANLSGVITHIDEHTLRKRRHSNNATSTVSSRPLSKKLRSRLIFLRSLVTAFSRSRSRGG